MSIILVDTHAHLDFDVYDSDRDETIQRAFDSGVKAILTIGIDVATSKKAVLLAEKYDGIYATAGIHPNDSARATAKTVSEIEALCRLGRVVAIGEIGLDYFRDHSPPVQQKQIFNMHLDLAEKLNLPVIIHLRAAETDMMQILRQRKSSHYCGVFHCFSGDTNLARELMALGFFISFTGNITYKNSKATEVLKQVPLTRLLTETDSPFMAPVPHRGQRNEPGFVHKVAEKIANVHAVSIKEVAATTRQNAEKLFGITVIHDSVHQNI